MWLIIELNQVAFSTPYTDNISQYRDLSPSPVQGLIFVIRLSTVWVQYLPIYFNQAYAGQFSYVLALSCHPSYF